MSVEFFQTRMGKTFYEHTMPELVRQLERLNEQMEKLVIELRHRGQHLDPGGNDG